MDNDNLDIKIRIAQKVNDDLYKEMLNNIKIHDTDRIVNEGEIDYQCNYYTIYHNKETKYVGLYNVRHCSCDGTEDDEPESFADEKLIIVDTIEDFYKKCKDNSIIQVQNENKVQNEVQNAYIKWFEDNYLEYKDKEKIREIKEEKIREIEKKIIIEIEEEKIREKKEKIMKDEEKEKELNGILCNTCLKKNLIKYMYQVKNGFECKKH